MSVLLLRCVVGANWLGYNTTDERESKIPRSRVGCCAISETTEDKYCNLGKGRC